MRLPMSSVMQFVSKQEQRVLRQARVLFVTAAGQGCCCYYAIIVNLWLSLTKSWNILVYFQRLTTIIKLNSQTLSLRCCQKCITAWPFHWNRQEKVAEYASSHPSFNTLYGLTADKVSLQITTCPPLCLSHCFYVFFFIHTDRHKQKHLHCHGIFTFFKTHFQSSWKQQHSNAAINQLKAAERGQEEEAKDTSEEKSGKKDGGRYYEAAGGQGQRNEAWVEERKGSLKEEVNEKLRRDLRAKRRWRLRKAHLAVWMSLCIRVSG